MLPPALPKKKREERRVFLESVLWEELSEIAEFHTRVFSIMGVDELFSRNDLMEYLLTWGTRAYWEDKGGKPISKEDHEKKARRHAELLAKGEDKKL